MPRIYTVNCKGAKKASTEGEFVMRVRRALRDREGAPTRDDKKQYMISLMLQKHGTRRIPEKSLNIPDNFYGY